MLKTKLLSIISLKQNQFILQSINTMALRLFGIIVLFGVTLVLTHNYDPVIIGQYDFIRTYLLVIGSICIIGTDQSILYFTGILKPSLLEVFLIHNLSCLSHNAQNFVFSSIGIGRGVCRFKFSGVW